MSFSFGVLSDDLGHVYYICPECKKQMEQGTIAHQHENGEWIQTADLKNYYMRDKFKKWDQIIDNKISDIITPEVVRVTKLNQ